MCHECTEPCEKIGKSSKTKSIKDLCCPCYSQIDQDFTRERWCVTCQDKIVDTCYLCKKFRVVTYINSNGAVGKCCNPSFRM